MGSGRGTGMALMVGVATIAAGAAAATGDVTRETAPSVASPCVAPAGFAPPFTRVYHLRTGGTLVFVAVGHGRDTGDESHRQVAAALDRFHPSLVLIEGISSGSPEAIAFDRAAAERQFATGSIQENLYAVKLASDRGVEFASWDLRPDEAMRHAVEDGFALADVVGAHLVRAESDPSVPASQAMVRSELRYAARVGSLDAFDYAAWFAQHYPVPPSGADRTPCGVGIASRILRAESDARSRHLVETITTRAAAGRVVMVEAGANHWLALQPYLRHAATDAG